MAMGRSRWWVATVLWVTGVVAGGWLAVGPVRAGGEGREPAGAADLSHGAMQRLIFVAILDGLLEDGVGPEIRPVLDADERGGHRHFVTGCPSCTPVVDAFRCHAARALWLSPHKGLPYSEEAESKLTPEEREDLTSGSDERVRKVLGSLVDRYVRRHIDRRRFTEVERAVVQRRLEEFRKKGMATLGSYRAAEDGTAPPGMKDCPSCDGAAGILPR